MERVRVHLNPLEGQGTIALWEDTKIKPGTRWREEIQNALKQARAAILLVTADFLASAFIRTNELPPLLRAAQDRGVRILPVIIKPCRFEQTEGLREFQAVNNPSRPLIALGSAGRERVFTELAGIVEEALRPARVADKPQRWLVEQEDTSEQKSQSTREAAFGEYTVRELESGSIEVERNGHLVRPAKPALREIARQLNVGLRSRYGSLLNTRRLGRLIIAELTKKPSVKRLSVAEEKDLGPRSKTSYRPESVPARKRDELRLQFWRQLLDLAKSEGLPFHARRSPTTAHWIGGSVGIAGYSWNYIIWLKDEVAVELMIDTNDIERNKRAFDALYQNRARIEASFGAPLEWNRLDDKSRSEIRHTRRIGGVTAPQEEWPAIQSAMVDDMARLTKALQPYLASLPAELGARRA